MNLIINAALLAVMLQFIDGAIIGHEVNVDCIPDNKGINYIGTVNVTQTGLKCLDWMVNRVYYWRFKLRGKKIEKNYCRNPDSDKKGPWCYVKKSYNNNYAHDYCNITICKSPNIAHLGVDILNTCPEGFIRTNSTRCLLPEYLINQLPLGFYAFKAYKSYKCPTNFEEKHFFPNRYCVHKTYVLKSEIAYPKYLKNVKGKNIFEFYLLNKQACPSMSGDVTVLMRIHPSFSICCYFYKLFNKLATKPVEYRMVYVSEDPCPKNWTKHSLPFALKWFNLCQPPFETRIYPEGQYCLLKFSSEKSCPHGFVEMVSTKTKSQLCCRDGRNKPILYSKLKFLELMKLKSIVFLNTVRSLCRVKEIKPSTVVLNTYTSYDTDIFHCFDGVYFPQTKCLQSACVVRKINKLKFAYALEPGWDCTFGNKSLVKVIGSKGALNFYFCVYEVGNNKFPDGDYCIFKIGGACPNGFKSNRNYQFLSNYYYRLNSMPDTPNLFRDSYCCKIRENITKTTFSHYDRLPFVTKKLRFGLPKKKCFHGYWSHVALQDDLLCRYVPKNTLWKMVMVYIAPKVHCKHYLNSLVYRSQYKRNHLYYQVHCRHYFGSLGISPGGNYCLYFKNHCNKNFYYLSYAPIVDYVICCRRNSSDYGQNLYKWTNQNYVTLLKVDSKCPKMDNYKTKDDMIIEVVRFTGVLNQAHKRNLTKIATFQLGSYKLFWCQYVLVNSSVLQIWPSSEYALPKPLSGCPKNFETGSVQHSMETTESAFTHSIHSMHWSGEYMIGWHKIRLEYCVRKFHGQWKMRQKVIMPLGQFCVFRVGPRCPYAFKSGYVKFLELTTLQNSSQHFIVNGSIPKIDYAGGYIFYHFCCQVTLYKTKMLLPTNQGPFYLLRFGEDCQQVVGMRFTEEFLCIDAEDSDKYKNKTFKFPYVTKGYTPITGSNIRGCDFQINVCYYEKNVPVKLKPPLKFNSTWPYAKFGFFKPLKQKCPKGFLEGKILISGKIPMFPDSAKRFFLDFDKDMGYLSYCNRNVSGVMKSDLREWPSGNYCFFFNDKCPKGMYAKSFYFNANIQNISGSHMNWNKLCCKKQNSANISTNFSFPSTHYSLVALTDKYLKFKCSEHYDKRMTAITIFGYVLCYYEDLRLSSTGAQTVSVTQFPPGNYLLPVLDKSRKNCPPDFRLVEHKHRLSGLKSTIIRSRTVTMSFCTPTKTNTTNTKQQIFPRGNYCILTTKAVCPSQFTKDHIITIPGYYRSRNSFIRSHYLSCCQSYTDNLIMNFDYRYAADNVTFGVYSNGLMCNLLNGHSQVTLVKRDTMLRSPSDAYKPLFPPIIENDEDIYNSYNVLGICLYHWKSWTAVIKSQCSCSENATCTITTNGPVCRCKINYFGNGKVCGKFTPTTDNCADICPKSTSACVLHKYKNEYNCQCNNGYKGDGITCKPSCETRRCNIFSRCILAELESFCTCKSNAIENFDGKCHGTVSESLEMLPELRWIPINEKCLTMHRWNDFFKMIHKTRPKFIILIPPHLKIDSTCNIFYKNVILEIYDLPKRYESWNKTVKFGQHSKIQLSMNNRNEWTVNNHITVNNSYIFIDGIILMLNDQIYGIPEYSGRRSHFLGYPSISVICLISSIIVGVVIAAIVLLVKKYRNIQPSRLTETQSMTNILFNPNDDGQIEMVN